MTEKKKNHFEVLNSIDVSKHTEKKEGLTYLTWAWAWAELKKHYPDASYKVITFDNLPYAYDPKTGYMVYTEMTIDAVTHCMWLPVMDSKNKAMKAEPYTYKTKYGDKEVQAATMFDINKTIMRCLVKNISMFGLGLYIYAGEDLPEGQEVEEKAPEPKQQTAKSKIEQYNKFVKNIEDIDVNNEKQVGWLKESFPKWLEWTNQNYGADYANQLQDKYDEKLAGV